MRIGVIMGGPSSEREISIATGNEMLKYINTEKYDVKTILIHAPEDIYSQLKDIDFALLALHGEFGEDGTIQDILETMGIPYSGSGVHASRVCMNKHASKTLLTQHHIPTGKWQLITPETASGSFLHLAEYLGLPFIVKPNQSGSSLGISIINGESDYVEAIELAMRFSEEILAEEYIQGNEITCSILDGELLPIIEIIPQGDIFTYPDKYETNTTIKRPSQFSDSMNELIKEVALETYELHQCEIYARIDIIIRNSTPYVLEVNTLPGMTVNSFFPRSAGLAGLSYTHLLDKLITLSMELSIA